MGGLLSGLSYLLRPTVHAPVDLYTHPQFPAVSALALAGGLLLLLSLPGMYARQAAQAGRLGLVGYLLFSIGLAALDVGSNALYTFIPRYLIENAGLADWFATEGGFESRLGSGYMIYFLVGFVAINSGTILYGIATFRARVFPRAAALLIALAIPITFVLSSVPGIGDRPLLILFVALIWCGIWLWNGKRRAPSGSAMFPAAASDRAPDPSPGYPEEWAGPRPRTHI